jgi:hypothetical protein
VRIGVKEMPENEYLPYKTINVFINYDNLEYVMQEVLTGLNNLSKAEQISFSKSFRKHVKVLGFRDPMRAPLMLRVNALVSGFEEKDEVVPFALSTWTKLNADFAEKVKAWLDSEGWKDLAMEREYEETKGFLAEWPNKLTFDKLVKKFKKENPDVSFERDDLILMVLWISGQLPKEQSNI